MDYSLTHAADTARGEVAATPLARLASRAVRIGPYAVLVLLVPGGSLIALILGLYRSLRSPRGHAATLRPAFLRTRSCT